MALTIPQLFYSTSGANETDASNPRYAPIADVSSTYVPFGLDTLNNLASVTRSVTWTDSSSGNTVDDKIISEFAAYFWDTTFQTAQFDPETGQPENRHWQTAMQILNSKYGVLVGGDIVPPLYGLEERAAGTLLRVDSTDTNADSSKPDL